MSSRSAKRVKRALEKRINEYKSDDPSEKKPGSLNRNKSRGGARRGTKKRR